MNIIYYINTMSLSATYEDILGTPPPYNLDDSAEYLHNQLSVPEEHKKPPPLPITLPPSMLSKSLKNKKKNKKNNKRWSINEDEKNAEVSLCYQCYYKNNSLPVVFGAKTMDTLHADSNQMYSQILNTMKIKFTYDNSVCVRQRAINYMLDELDTLYDKKYTSFKPKYMECIKIFMWLLNNNIINRDNGNYIKTNYYY